MNQNKTLAGLMIGLIVLILVYLCTFMVSEGHRAMLLQLGDIVTDKSGQPVVYGPGLHFKLPLIVKVQDFDVRLQSFSVDSSRILTAEQKYVLVDYYAKWRIHNLALYYTRTSGMADRAEMLLKQKINDALRAAFGQRDIKEVISDDRMKIMTLLQEKANQSATDLGVQVIDVRIKGIDLPKEVRESVFQRMRTEREQVATQHRAQGKAMAESLRADADGKVAVVIATAKSQAQQIRAAGDSQAAAIYTKAYEQNPQFYAFYRSLEAYQNIFSRKGTVMVLRPNSPFFKYFVNGTEDKPQKSDH